MAHSKTQSKAEIYLHFVWATYQRLPLLTPNIERAVFRCIEGEARGLCCKVYALNGMPDHVHLLVKVPTRVSASQLANHVKGVSSRFVHVRLPGNEAFQWQNGYGVFSVGRNQVKRVVAYIENQKQHHAEDTLHADWEETEEEYIPEEEHIPDYDCG